jgi:hypothetical protein
MMSILQQAISNFEDRPMSEIEVPEWSAAGGEAVKVYFKTPNAKTIDLVTRESKGSNLEMIARLVAHTVTDQNGKRLFTSADYSELMIRTDPVALNRIAAAIMAGAKVDPEAAEKN